MNENNSKLLLLLLLITIIMVQEKGVKNYTQNIFASHAQAHEFVCVRVCVYFVNL
jgi:hypothetical protein